MSALPPDTLLRMNIDKSMGFGLQKYAGIKDMNLAIELPSGLQPLPRAQGQKTPYRGGKKKLCAWGDVQRWPFRQKGMAKEKQPQGRRDARALRGGPTKKKLQKANPELTWHADCAVSSCPRRKDRHERGHPIGLQSRRKNGNAHRCWQQEDGAGDGVKPETWSCQA